MIQDHAAFNHYSEVKGADLASWFERWPNFSPREVSCKGTGELYVDFRAMDMLQDFRNRVGVPLFVNSAYRTKIHNRKVGGAKGSKHLVALAFDIQVGTVSPDKFVRIASIPRKALSTSTLGRARS